MISAREEHRRQNGAFRTDPGNAPRRADADTGAAAFGAKKAEPAAEGVDAEGEGVQQEDVEAAEVEQEEHFFQRQCGASGGGGEERYR